MSQDSWLFPTALGHCAISWSAKRVRALILPGAGEDALRRRCGPLSEDPPAWIKEIAARIQQHLGGEHDPLTDIPVDLGGRSSFSRKVYGRLRKVRPGQTICYNHLADQCGSPGGARAVGRAMANNPIPMIIPCHRVLSAGGGLGGFSAHGGVALKLRMLSMEGADLRPIARAGVGTLKKADPVLGQVIRRVGPYRLQDQQIKDPFTALAASIVHQQVSMKAGATIFGRLMDLARKGKVLSPARVLRADPGKLRGVGLSRQKASYIQDLAHRTSDGSLPLERMARMDDEAIIDALTEVKGIGRWSAEMFLMFRLGRLDVLPVGDLGLRRGAQHLYGMEDLPPPAELYALAERWAPFRSIATWYLWRSLEAGGL